MPFIKNSIRICKKKNCEGAFNQFDSSKTLKTKEQIFIGIEYEQCVPCPFLNTVEPLPWDTSIQGIPPFRGHKIWSLKNVHIIFESVTSIEGAYLFRGEGLVYLVPKTGFDSVQGTP